MEGIAESVSVQTPQEQDVSSLGAFLDSTSSEELITASPQTEPCDQKLVAAAVESASMSSKGSTITSPQSVLDNTTDGSPPSASSPGSKILTRSRRNWYQVFYIRMDRGGSFCMYPNLGGPFQSIDEADDAIDRYLDELRHRAGYGFLDFVLADLFLYCEQLCLVIVQTSCSMLSFYLLGPCWVCIFFKVNRQELYLSIKIGKGVYVQ